MRLNLNSAVPRIDWHYQFDVELHKIGDQGPSFIFQDLNDTRASALYLAGSNKGQASIIKFRTNTSEILWEARFEDLVNIRAIHELTGQFLGCGDIKDQGTGIFMMKYQG